MIQIRKEKATELRQALNEAQEKVSQLNAVQDTLSEIVVVGKTVNHKSFGRGTITSIDDGRYTIGFENAGTKELGINLSIANGLITMDGLALERCALTHWYVCATTQQGTIYSIFYSLTTFIYTVCWISTEKNSEKTVKIL